MALSFTDYTSNAIVRGLLGVAEEEVTDDVFTTMSASFLQEVTFALEDLNSAIPTLFETAKTAVDASTASVAQQRFYDIVQLYAAYITADHCADGAVEMFAPKKITDGKAELERREDPYSSLRAALKASLARWRSRLSAALTVLDSSQSITTTARTLVSSTGLAVDPVTGV